MKASAKVNGNLKVHHWQHRGIEFATKIPTSARRKTSQGQESGIRKGKHGEERTDNNQLAKIARNGKPEAPKTASKMLARKLRINMTGEQVGGMKYRTGFCKRKKTRSYCGESPENDGTSVYCPRPGRVLSIGPSNWEFIAVLQVMES